MKKLQQTLNSNGYTLDVDGKFGSKTQAAVKDYQKKKGLAVDGIVGTKTWGALTGKASNPSTSASSNSVQSQGFKYATKKPVYKKSEGVSQAQEKLEAWEGAKPDEYKSKYSEKINEILNEILGREDFSYSISSDPLYEQYKGLYTNNGKKAMMDTVGNASALSGGYTNSYAVTAGEQAYNEYLTQLNDIALDLRDRAYKEYTDKGDKLINDATLLRSLDKEDYEKYLESLEVYYKDGEYLLEKLANMSDSEFEMFSEELSMWESERDHAFDVYKDKVARDEFKLQMDFKKAEAERDQANKDRAYRLSSAKTSSSSGSSSTKSTTKKSGLDTTYPRTYTEFCTRTGNSEILTSHEYSLSENYKQKYKTYQDYLKAMYKLYKKE